jgi:hypothetical protein
LAFASRLSISKFLMGAMAFIGGGPCSSCCLAHRPPRVGWLQCGHGALLLGGNGRSATRSKRSPQDSPWSRSPACRCSPLFAGMYRRWPAVSVDQLIVGFVGVSC